MSLNDDHVRSLKYGTFLENPMSIGTKWIATEKLKKNLILKLEERIQQNTVTGSVTKVNYQRTFPISILSMPFLILSGVASIFSKHTEHR